MIRKPNRKAQRKRKPQSESKTKQVTSRKLEQSLVEQTIAESEEETFVAIPKPSTPSVTNIRDCFERDPSACIEDERVQKQLRNIELLPRPWLPAPQPSKLAKTKKEFEKNELIREQWRCRWWDEARSQITRIIEIPPLETPEELTAKLTDLISGYLLATRLLPNAMYSSDKRFFARLAAEITGQKPKKRPRSRALKTRVILSMVDALSGQNYEPELVPQGIAEIFNTLAGEKLSTPSVARVIRRYRQKRTHQAK